jgi:heme oxygenase
MASPDRSSQDPRRSSPLLLALRRALRPDRARVEAYVSLVERQAGWEAYASFLAAHRAFTDALGQALDVAGAPHRALRDGPRTDGTPEPLPEARSPAQALGYLYVLEAFRLGWAVLARRARGLGESKAERDEAGRAWAELARALEAMPTEEHATVLQGARDAFAQWERRLGATLARLGLGRAAPGARAA